jgi:hypothetical protein
MGARALVVVKLVVGNGALAAVVGTFYHGQRNDVIHNGAWDEATAMLAHLALLTGALGETYAAS